MSTSRFRRLTDLFVQGREVPLPDGTFLWVQAVNSYERDECIADAQTARARLVLALKNNGAERVKIEARLAEHGREAMEKNVVEAKLDDKMPEIVAAMEDDPEWSERIGILRRTNFAQAAKPADPAEVELMDQILKDWSAAIEVQVNTEREWLTRTYQQVNDEELLDDYTELWLDRRGSEKANAEYALTELWYATRYCEAVSGPDGPDHGACAGHQTRVFASKNETRGMPDALHTLLSDALAQLAMGGRDPKGSASAASSSGSSPTPNGPVASTPSTSIETHELPPGTSPQLLVTH